MTNETKSLTLRIKGDVEHARRSFKGFTGDLGALKSGLLSVAGPLAALTSAAGFSALVTQQIQLGDELSKTSQKLGITVEAFSAYVYAAKLSGVSNEELTSSLARLSKAIQEAATDSGSRAAQMFQVLGVQVKDSAGKVRDLNVIFEDVAAKLSTVRDGTAKTAVSMELFGRSGFNLAPLLNNLQELTEEARRTGNVVSTDFAQAAEEFNDTLERMQLSLGLFLAKSQEGPGVLRGMITALKSVQFVALGLAQGLEELGTSLGAYAAAVVDIVKLNFAEARRTLQLLEQDLARIQKKGEAARAALFAEPTAPATAATRGTVDLALPEKEGRKRSDDFDKEARRDLERLIKEEEEYNAALEKSAEKIRDVIDPARVLFAELAKIDDLYRRGRLSIDEYLDATLEVQGRLNELGKETKKTADEMTEFAKEAARGMQGAFADEFFNILDGQMDNLGESFARLLKRMAAELAASEVMKLLTGDFGRTGEVGGALGALFAGVFHEGGLVGAGGPGRMVPALAFADAQVMHDGGRVGLRDDEVPIIARKGEVVLTPEQLRGGAPGAVKVTVENKGTPIQATNSEVSFDAQGMMVKVITEDVQRGGQISNAFSRTFGLRRR